MADTIAISLIICTRNRAERLVGCLAAVAAIRCRVSWEAVIVDNGSSDTTPTVIGRFFARNALQVVSVREPVTGGCRAKNTGIAASRGRVLAFTDDDCYPAPDYLERVWELFAADPQLGFIGGRILLYDPDDDPLTTNESLETVHFAAGGIVPCGALHGANIAFRRSALEAVGGFDPALGPGTPYAGEDWDAAARVCLAGWAGGYFPEPVVLHHHGRKAAEAAVLLRSYHYGGGAVYAKLVTQRTTRWPYIRHWMRRTLGDVKSGHWRKLGQQFHGAFAYWRGRRSAGSGSVMIRRSNGHQVGQS